MKESSNVIHVRLKSDVNICPGNLDIDKNNFPVIPICGEYFAVSSDVFNSEISPRVLIRIIHQSKFVEIDNSKIGDVEK